MNNKIDSTFKIENPDKIFGTSKEYICCEIDGMPALFTPYQLAVAMERAAKRPEAAAPPKSNGGWWNKICALFGG